MGRFVSIDARCVSITPTSWQGQRICASYSFEAKITELMCCMCTVILIDITVSWGEHPYLYIYIDNLNSCNLHTIYTWQHIHLHINKQILYFPQTSNLQHSPGIHPAKRLMVERPPGDSPISKVQTTSDGKLQTRQRLEPFEWVQGYLEDGLPIGFSNMVFDMIL